MISKTLRIAAIAAGLAGALLATSASAADYRLGKPAVAPVSSDLVTKVAMVQAPIAKNASMVEKTQVRRRGGGGGRVVRGGGGGRVVRGGRRGGNFGRNVAIGVGAAAVLGIIGAAAANAEGRESGGNCRRWAYRCDDGEGWACRKFRRYCD